MTLASGPNFRPTVDELEKFSFLFHPFIKYPYGVRCDNCRPVSSICAAARELTVYILDDLVLIHGFQLHPNPNGLES